jgi:T4 RnlA family RNA ligase
MNLETLHKYKEDGLLRCQTHPTLPLTIWNYTEKVQYERLWDKVTLSCRGLVFDDEGNQVSYPFKKFFNIEENKHTPTNDFEIYEKVDGSLITVFNYNGEWVASSRGSFTSDQAIAAQKLFNRFKGDMLDPNATYLFELIAPWNRIVVDYGDAEELILLGIKSKEYECNYEELIAVSKYLGCKVTQLFHFEDYTEIQKLNWANTEGFIVRFSNGDRCKIKFEEYLRLHKIMTEVSTTGIWESLKNGDDIAELLKDVPDEFYDKIDEYVEELVSQYIMLEREYTWIFNKLKDIEDRARFAELAKRYKYPQLLFKMMDGSDYSEALWRIIKPEWKKL